MGKGVSKKWAFELERNIEEVDKFNWSNLAKGSIEEVERRLKQRDDWSKK